MNRKEEGSLAGTWTARELLKGGNLAYTAPRLLVFGCVFGIFGFLLVVAVMVMCDIEAHVGTKYISECSDYRPLPLTVSDLVMRWESVTGRVFFAFEFLAGVSIFFSAFSFCFKNATCDCFIHTGPCQPKCCTRLIHCFDLRWCDFRQFGPPVGLLLITLVPTVPINGVNGVHDGIMLVTHTLAAFLLFFGTAACELHFWRFHVRTTQRGEQESLIPARRRGQDRIPYIMGKTERNIRAGLNIGNVFFFLAFIGFNGLVVNGLCHNTFFLKTRTGCAAGRDDVPCRPVTDLAECTYANVMFADHVTNVLAAEGRDHLLVPVDYPPQSDEQPGCLMRQSARDVQFRYGEGTASAARDPRSWEVCACGAHETNAGFAVSARARLSVGRAKRHFNEARPMTGPLEEHRSKQMVRMERRQLQTMQTAFVADTWSAVMTSSCRTFYAGSFGCEIIAGLSVVTLHLVIWYFAEERKAPNRHLLEGQAAAGFAPEGEGVVGAAPAQ